MKVNKYKKFNISWLSDTTYTPRFATEEEKQRLFDTIKENGYRWNPETKTLEMLVEPKFKVGDRIRCKNVVDKYGGFEEGIIDTITDNKYGIVIPHLMGIVSLINITDQDNWELVTLKFKTGDRIRRKIKRRNYIDEGEIKSVSFNFYDVFTTDEKSIYIPIREQDEWEIVPDKIKPKFKVGDEVVTKGPGLKVPMLITNIVGEFYYYDKYGNGDIIEFFTIKEQDNYVLVSDKIEPKFKVGDVVQDEDGYRVEIIEVNIDEECYEYISKILKGIGSISFKEQDDWKLVLDEIEPKFKVGDRVKHKQSFISGAITNIDDDCYKIKYDSGAVSFAIIKDQDDWELVSDEIEPKFKAGDKIRLKGNPNYIYNITGIKENKSGGGVTFDLRFSEQDKNGNWFPKFDISTLKPFESRVLVRDHESQTWRPAIFGCYIGKDSPYYVLGGLYWKQCIPYEGNENLCGKKDDCKEYYKTWEE